jgi:hypothetical protein
MKTPAVILVLACAFGALFPVRAADIGQSPNENVKICGSEECAEVRLENYFDCWSTTGMFQIIGLQPANDLFEPIGGVPLSWNGPALLDPDGAVKLGTTRSYFDWIGPQRDSYGKPFVPVYTAELGNGMSVPLTVTGQPRYPSEYIKVCDTYGAGFFYIPGTDTCIRMGGAGQQYEQRPPTGKQSFKYYDQAVSGSSGGASSSVEYVRICSLYGDGFYYIPGTDTCIRITQGTVDQKPAPRQYNIVTGFDGPQQEDVKKGQKDAAAPPANAPPPANAALSQTPRWIDSVTGDPAQVGPAGTMPGLFDANEAYNVRTGTRYVRDNNGVWKNEKTGEVVPEIPLNSTLDQANPGSATHLYSGRKFSKADGKPPAPQTNASDAAATPSKPPGNETGWVDAKTGKQVPTGPAGTRPGLFDADEAYNPSTGKGYVRKDGIWKDRDTGQVVPEIPINSQLDPTDPNKAKHTSIDRTFVNVSPQSQAKTRAEIIKRKLEEAKAALKAANNQDDIHVQKFRIAELEAGKDPEEEDAKAKARAESARQVQKDLQDIQLPTAQAVSKTAKEEADKEKARLDGMPKDGPGSSISRDQQENKLREAGRRYFDAEKKVGAVKSQLQSVKDQINKYGELRPQEPENDTGKPGTSEKSNAAAKSATPAKANAATKSGAPGKSGKSETTAEKAPEKPTADDKAIKIGIDALGWSFDQPSKTKPEDFAINFQPRWTPSLSIGLKFDGGYDQSPVQTTVRNGKGSVTIPYEDRTLWGFSWAAPGSSFVAGLKVPKVSEYLIQADNNWDIPKSFATDRLPLGTAMRQETIQFGDTRFIRLGIRQRYDERPQWTEARTIADLFGRNPEEVVDNQCWTKLPAYDLEPAASTALGQELPRATLKLSDSKRNRSIAR